MPRSFNRSDRVSDEIHKQLANFLQVDFENPDLGFITITRVELTRDLSYAKVFITEVTSKEPESQVKILNQAAGYLRSQLDSRIRMRQIPVLKFVYDYAIEKGDNVQNLIRDISKKNYDNESDNNS